MYVEAGRIAQSYDFLGERYQGDILALTGYAVQQPIDDYNRPANTAYASSRVPPSDTEVEVLFTQ